MKVVRSAAPRQEMQQGRGVVWLDPLKRHRPLRLVVPPEDFDGLIQSCQQMGRPRLQMLRARSSGRTVSEQCAGTVWLTAHGLDSPFWRSDSSPKDMGVIG